MGRTSTENGGGVSDIIDLTEVRKRRSLATNKSLNSPDKDASILIEMNWPTTMRGWIGAIIYLIAPIIVILIAIKLTLRRNK